MRLLAENLVIDRGGRRLVDGLSFAVAAGEMLVVTGRNGAGKSTLLRVLAGFIAPVAGRVALDAGARGRPPEAPMTLEVHYVGHADGLKAALTAEENLAFWQAMLGEAGRPGALAPSAALAQFDLAHAADLPAKYLSAGQRRRLALARLLIARRPVWLIDEPTAALDRESREGFAGVLRAHLGAGGLIVAATHVPLGLDGARVMALGENP